MVRLLGLLRFLLLLFLLVTLVSVSTATETTADTIVDEQQQYSISTEKTTASTIKHYYHLVVLVHGYMGSDREQEYLGEALIEKSKNSIQELFPNSKSNDDNNNNGVYDSCTSHHRHHEHQFVVLSSKANVGNSTDGITNGGQRLAAEISDWIQQHTAKVQLNSNSTTIMTLSLIGNSLGGLYSRYALAELYYNIKHQKWHNKILPLIFCTTSAPHLGVSQETFFELPKWVEPYVGTVMKQQTMDDLFGSNNSTIVMDMCTRSNNFNDRSSSFLSDVKNKNNNENRINNNHRDYLYPLEQFQKRIAVASAYNTDFLVSVSSAGILSSNSNSVHYHQHPDYNDTTCFMTGTGTGTGTETTRLMKNIDYVTLQVTTATKNKTSTSTIKDGDSDNNNYSRKSCVDSLDQLGWHKIFLDARKIMPSWLQLTTPELIPKVSYTSKELRTQFKRYGTLLPIAHPLNMANSRTDLYRELTKKGQPIMDALAELLILDMIELSEKKQSV